MKLEILENLKPFGFQIFELSEFLTSLFISTLRCKIFYKNNLDKNL